MPKSGPATRTVPDRNGSRLSTNSSSARHAANSPSSNPVRLTRFRYTAGMIWSVSTLDRRSGTPTPVWVVNGCIAGSLTVSSQVVGRGQGAAYRGGGGDQRGDQVRAAALALPALEVAVRCGRRP